MTPQQRYVAAGHAVQTGVKADIETDLNQESQGATTPKHLRVGLNNVMSDHGSLAALLVEKGVITEAEYLEAIAAGIEREQSRYEQLLTERFGYPVKLA
jgi:hypothetical protein